MLRPIATLILTIAAAFGGWLGAGALRSDDDETLPPEHVTKVAPESPSVPAPVVSPPRPRPRTTGRSVQDPVDALEGFLAEVFGEQPSPPATSSRSHPGYAVTWPRSLENQLRAMKAAALTPALIAVDGTITIERTDERRQMRPEDLEEMGFAPAAILPPDGEAGRLLRERLDPNGSVDGGRVILLLRLTQDLALRLEAERRGLTLSPLPLRAEPEHGIAVAAHGPGPR